MTYRGLFILCGLFALGGLFGCQSSPSIKEAFVEKAYFEVPPPGIPPMDAALFERGVGYQEKRQSLSAIETWKEFLKIYPSSYEAHNNLGMAYYTNDQVGAAIKQLEVAHSLEPSERKIKKNLVDALKFQARMLKETRDYHGAIAYLRRIGKLSGLEERRLMQLRIEALQGQIFEEVKRTNSLSSYQEFIRLYPENVEKVKEAKLRMQVLQQQEPVVDFPDLGLDEPDQAGGIPDMVEEETLIYEETVTLP
ncbi:MAG: tetratricopeptide repeat protein [Nitrospinaceae bacterium]|nr:MAG: tetratricopeptide repeat protein [Nitrospinaceae bacterium]